MISSTSLVTFFGYLNIIEITCFFLETTHAAFKMKMSLRAMM